MEDGKKSRAGKIDAQRTEVQQNKEPQCGKWRKLERNFSKLQTTES